MRGDKCDAGAFGGQFIALGRAVLEDISAGRPVRRWDAVLLARAVLEGDAVRAAEAVLEAEARLAFGRGYRLYFGKRGQELVLLLLGGDKRSQTKDMDQAKTYWMNYLQENKRGKTK